MELEKPSVEEKSKKKTQSLPVQSFVVSKKCHCWLALCFRGHVHWQRPLSKMLKQLQRFAKIWQMRNSCTNQVIHTPIIHHPKTEDKSLHTVLKRKRPYFCCTRIPTPNQPSYMHRSNPGNKDQRDQWIFLQVAPCRNNQSKSKNLKARKTKNSNDRASQRAEFLNHTNSIAKYCKS